MILQHALLPISTPRTFELLAEETSSWWPEGPMLGEDDAAGAAFRPPGADGALVAGGGAVLGTVRRWEPPERIEIVWIDGTDADRPTRVVLHLDPIPEGTRVRVEHRATPPSEAAWPALAPRAVAAWRRVLGALADVATRGARRSG